MEATSGFSQAALALGGSARAANEGVTVGNSDLIGTLDYSDTFTENGATRSDGTFPISAAGLVIENSYGNPTRSWTSSGFSINTDTSASTAGDTYPGNSGAGSSTGITQTGGSTAHFGIGYGLRTDFVVQAK